MCFPVNIVKFLRTAFLSSPGGCFRSFGASEMRFSAR